MTLVVRPEAERDVATQWNYIADQNEAASERYLQAVAFTYEAIRRQPGIGHEEAFRRRKGIRSWRVEGFPKYLIFYRIEGDRIEILRVLHGMRNLPRFFSHLSS
jgi:toxin ParE1/3/4